MECAREKGLRQIAFSLLSAGIFRGDRSLEAVLQIGVCAVRESAYSGLEEVHLVGFKAEELAALLSVCQSEFGDGAQACDEKAQQEWERLKSEVTALYMVNDFLAAIDKYGAAIQALEALVGEEPDGNDARRALSVLCTNRAMAGLQVVRRAQEANKSALGASLPKELRAVVMRASIDASRATELDGDNAKAWLRKGQALLLMSSMQQRASESVKALERARVCPGLTDTVRKDVDRWLAVARRSFDEQTPMPENCPQM